MSTRPQAPSAPNYTNAFLWCAGVQTFMAFWVILASWGISWVLLIALAMDYAIKALRRT
ncbi:hypothetical protein [Shimia ponticola]|uniref:hypothetical protein n=1 Tax=Shimia ponticola TaxID=2582893 RepID=UPI00164BDB7C|nr:hypothetical protein [Shimia ponticola]